MTTTPLCRTSAAGPCCCSSPWRSSRRAPGPHEASTRNSLICICFRRHSRFRRWRRPPRRRRFRCRRRGRAAPRGAGLPAATPAALLAMDNGAMPAGAPPHVQPPADGRAAVALPVPRQGAARRQHRELLRLHQPVRGPRSPVSEVQGPRSRRRRLSDQRLRQPGARHQQGNRRVLPHHVRHPVPDVREDDRRPARREPLLRDADRAVGTAAALEFPQVRHRPQRPQRPQFRQRRHAGAEGPGRTDRTPARRETRRHEGRPGRDPHPPLRPPRRATCPPPEQLEQGSTHAHRRRRFRNRRPGQRPPAAPAGARRHAVRGGPRPRRPHRHRRRDARRRHRAGGHRLPGVQRPHLPAPRRAVRRAGRGERRQRDVVLGARRRARARVGRHRSRVAVRAAVQRAASRLLADAGRHRALQPCDDGDDRGRHGADAVAGGVPRQRRLRRAVPRLVPAADGGRDLVEPEAGHPRLPAADLRALLPQPRAALDFQSSAVADRRRRRPRIRAPHRRRAARRARRHAGARACAAGSAASTSRPAA